MKQGRLPIPVDVATSGHVVPNSVYNHDRIKH